MHRSNPDKASRVTVFGRRKFRFYRVDLEQAFFYARHALLVSTGPSIPTQPVKLVTATAKAPTLDRSVGRAEALRRAMLALIDSGTLQEAHPSFWAPFVVVGEGAAK